MSQQNYINLIIQNDIIKLIPVGYFHIQDIFENNLGNVREFFIPFESETEIKTWINEQRNKMVSGEKIELVIISKSNDEFIGMVSLDNLLNDKKIEPRLWIAPKYQNKGYGKQSLELLINWYKSQPDSREIHYITDKHNNISQKLAISLGFVFEKEYVDEYGGEVCEFVL
jgi:RimJ/RimL family protein N-acetyltransferase